MWWDGGCFAGQCGGTAVVLRVDVVGRRLFCGSVWWDGGCGGLLWAGCEGKQRSVRRLSSVIAEWHYYNAACNPYLSWLRCCCTILHNTALITVCISTTFAVQYEPKDYFSPHVNVTTESRQGVLKQTAHVLEPLYASLGYFVLVSRPIDCRLEGARQNKVIAGVLD